MNRRTARRFDLPPMEAGPRLQSEFPEMVPFDLDFGVVSRTSPHIGHICSVCERSFVVGDDITAHMMVIDGKAELLHLRHTTESKLARRRRRACR